MKLRSIYTYQKPFGTFPFKFVQDGLQFDYWALAWSFVITVLLIWIGLKILVFSEVSIEDGLIIYILDRVAPLPFCFLLPLTLVQLTRKSSNLSQALMLTEEIVEPWSGRLKPLKSLLCLVVTFMFEVTSVVIMIIDGSEVVEIAFFFGILVVYFHLTLIQITYPIALLEKSFEHMTSLIRKKLTPSDIGDVLQLIEINYKCDDVFALLNDCFGLQMFLMYTNCLTLLVYIFYIMLLPFYYTSLLRMLAALFWTCLYGTLSWFPICICESVNFESENFYFALRKLVLQSNGAALASDPQVTLFLATKKELKFTACGYFDIDYKMATSMVAACTTYLVIIVQFSES